MTKQIYLFISLFILLFTSNIFAQKKPIKFGKISKSALEMKVCPFDSAAHAMILTDMGEAELVYEETSGEFFIEFKRIVRFKIFDKAGYEWANFSIPIYKSGRDEEKLTKFKANVFNMETGGDIKKTQVDKKELIIEETNDFYNHAKIAIPKISDGCVFEINYAIRSPFVWNLRDWQFQYQIPVAHSTYEVLYPEWFHYDKKFKGYDFEYLTVNDETSDNAKINYQQRTRTGGYNSKSEMSFHTIDYRRIRNKWAVEKCLLSKRRALFLPTKTTYLQ